MSHETKSKAIMVLTVLIGVACAACSTPFTKRLHTFGGPESIGTRVFIDGAFSGVLGPSEILRGPRVRGETSWDTFDVDLAKGDTVLKVGECLGEFHVSIRSGEHHLLFVSTRGESLRVQIDAMDEPGVAVSFRRGVAEQTDQ